MLTHFDRQAQLLLNAGYPDMLGISKTQFTENLEPLRARLEGIEPFECVGNIPVCIAFGKGVIGIADAMSRIEAKAASGVVDMTPPQRQPGECAERHQGTGQNAVDAGRRRSLDGAIS